MHHLSEQNIFIFLLQIFILLGLARGMGEIFRKFHQPAIAAEILAGILLGPTILGRFFPEFQLSIFPIDPFQQNMLETVSWLGVFFLLLEAGLEIDFLSAWHQRKDAVLIAVMGIVVPIAISFGFFLFLPDRYLVDPDKRIVFAFFMAIIMAITAMPVVTRALHDLNLIKTDLAFLIMSAHSVNDILGWLLFTFVLIFFNTGVVPWANILWIFMGTCFFVAFCLSIGRVWTDQAIASFRKKQMPEPSTSLTFICLLGLLGGAITQRIGIHALFGFFITGVMAGGAKALPERTRQVISQMVYAIFVPLFFAKIGLQIDFWKNFNLFLVGWMTFLSISGKFAGAWLGSSFTQNSKANRYTIAIAHIPGGMMEIVVGVMALQYLLITQEVFVGIVFSAIFSSIIFAPWMEYSLKTRKEVSVLEYFFKRGIVPDLKAKVRDGAIMELCELASGQGNMPLPEDLMKGILERENSFGTALEEGVAVPHARFAGMKRPMVLFGRSLSGIDWNSPDGKPTHYIFLILTPLKDDEVQVQILRVVATMMKEENTRERIMRARDVEEMWDILKKEFMSLQIKKM